jgi:hypothetical protein
MGQEKYVQKLRLPIFVSPKKLPGQNTITPGQRLFFPNRKLEPNYRPGIDENYFTVDFSL